MSALVRTQILFALHFFVAQVQVHQGVLYRVIRNNSQIFRIDQLLERVVILIEFRPHVGAYIVVVEVFQVLKRFPFKIVNDQSDIFTLSGQNVARTLNAMCGVTNHG